VLSSRQPVQRSLLRLLGDFDHISTAVVGSLTVKGQLHHLLNTDGTIDSICLLCFLRAARVENESDCRTALKSVLPVRRDKPVLFSGG
jgi:hypothetical protein